MAKFRDRYLKGKKTNARKPSSASDINRAAMAGTTRAKTAAEKAAEAERQERLMQLARAGQREVGTADRDVYLETELESRPRDELGESLIQTMTEPAYGTERAQREASYGLEPEAFPESLTDTGMRELREYERGGVQSKLTTLQQEAERAKGPYEQALKDYEESKSAAQQLRSGVDLGTNTAVLAGRLEERKAAFDEASKIYFGAQSRAENLRKGLLEGQTTAESPLTPTTAPTAIKNIQERRAELAKQLEDLEGARSAIEAASESRPVEKTYYMDEPADMYAYELRAKVKANRLAQSNVVSEINRLDSMLAEIPEVEAWTEEEALRQKEIETGRQERLRKLKDYEPGEEETPWYETGRKERLRKLKDYEPGQYLTPEAAHEKSQRRQKSVTDPIDPILISSMRSGYDVPDTAEPGAAAYLPDTGTVKR